MKCQDCNCELEPEDLDIETNRETALCPECWEKMESENKVDDDTHNRNYTKEGLK